MPTSTVAITLDLGCCRCRTKIQKILCCLQERCGFVFDKVEYDKDKVLVSGPFDAMDLCCKLRCKAGCFATKIEIVAPPQPKKKKKKKKEDPPPPATCKALIPYPCLYPYPYPCPSPCPNPQPTCPSSCATPRSCQCHSCRPPPPCPTPPRPCPAPVCNKCPTWTPCQCRGYPWVVCCEEKPDPGCAVM
ncbi:protein PYRICULARIA ORYZAE RESISTANCE 21-like [Miscanthus floridulus]|uniref:protein PYRICULARIA ORYZAE RESISTANCE 21-like n=1 Tax=Miscanthus floridulus TaxID=154761 RepID=UPI0034587604